MAVPNFGQMKELYQLQKKAKQVQKELKDLEIEAKSSDGSVAVVVSGEMKLVSVELTDEILSNRSLLQKQLVETTNQAMARAQSESASRMQPLLKDMNLPGMP